MCLFLELATGRKAGSGIHSALSRLASPELFYFRADGTDSRGKRVKISFAYIPQDNVAVLILKSSILGCSGMIPLEERSGAAVSPWNKRRICGQILDIRPSCYSLFGNVCMENNSEDRLRFIVNLKVFRQMHFIPDMVIH